MPRIYLWDIAIEVDTLSADLITDLLLEPVTEASSQLVVTSCCGLIY